MMFLCGRDAYFISLISNVDNFIKSVLKSPLLNHFFVILFLTLGRPAIAQTLPESHIVKSGETLWGIATKYYQRPEKWVEIQQKNVIKKPNLMQVNTELKMDSSNNLASRVTTTYAIVEHAGKGVWKQEANGTLTPLSDNMNLQIGDIIQTDAKGFASLMLGNGVRSVLPTNSVVQIQKSHSINGNIQTVRLKLLEGRIENYVPKRPQQPVHFEVETPSALLTVKGTVFRVHWTPEGSALEVLEGIVNVAKPNSQDQLVKAKQGMMLEGNSAFRIFNLIEAPQLASSNESQTGFLVRFKLTPRKDVQAWHAEVAKDAAFSQLINEIYTKEPEIRINNLPVGFYYLRISAIDKNGLEGEYHNEFFYVEPAEFEVKVKTDVQGVLNFIWEKNTPVNYILQISRDELFTNLVTSAPVQEGSAMQIGSMLSGRYFWRVIPPLTNDDITELKIESKTQNTTPYSPISTSIRSGLIEIPASK